MQTLHFSIVINAPKEKVWHTMLDDKTYREWTSAFNPSGSYYEGAWTAGSDILFLGPDKDGTVSGMISRIKESDPYNFLSIQHLGEIMRGERTMYEGKEMFENYTFTDADGGTEVRVDLGSDQDFPEEYRTMFDAMWPKGLEKLKELAEK